MRDNKLLKKILIITSILIASSILALGSYNKNYVKISDIVKPRKIALASIMINRDMLDSRYDKTKYINGEIYAEYIASNFVSNFNIDESHLSLVPLEEVLPKNLFDTLPQTFPIKSEYVAPKGYITTNDVSDDILASLEGKVDSIMFAQARLSIWSQRIIIYFSVYDLNRELVWRDTFDGTSKYIMADTSITPKTSYNVVLQNVQNQEKKYDEQLYIVIDEAIKDSVDKMAKKFPMIFSTNDYFQTIKTFSLTNANENDTKDME